MDLAFEAAPEDVMITPRGIVSILVLVDLAFEVDYILDILDKKGEFQSLF